MMSHAYRFATTLSKGFVDNPTRYLELMSAWQFQSFGGIEQLQLTKTAVVQELKKPNDIQIKVLASSVNPLDIAMIGGYGNVILDQLKKVDAFKLSCECDEASPITLGRDFCGEVVSKGTGSRKDLKIGDVVYGAVPPYYQGSHAEYVVIDDHLIDLKPDNLKPTEAAALPYTALTAWSALKITGDLAITDPKTKKVLVLGSSGGVGTAAVQLLKAWGSQVVATCSTDAVSLVQSLNADHVIDYTQKEGFREIELAGKYDIILDAAGNVNPTTYVPFLKEWSNSKFITLRSPVLKNTDNLGLIPGMVKNAADLFQSQVLSGALTQGSTVRWAFFAPLEVAVTEISQLVKFGKVIPVIDSTYHFDEMPEAYRRVSEGHIRGKVVVSHEERKVPGRLEV